MTETTGFTQENFNELAQHGVRVQEALASRYDQLLIAALAINCDERKALETWQAHSDQSVGLWQGWDGVMARLTLSEAIPPTEPAS